jgi:hypothetical protein
MFPGAAHIVLEDKSGGTSFFRAKPPDFLLLFSILVGSCSRLVLNDLRLPCDLQKSITVKIKQKSFRKCFLDRNRHSRINKKLDYVSVQGAIQIASKHINIVSFSRPYKHVLCLSWNFTFMLGTDRIAFRGRDATFCSCLTECLRLKPIEM